MSETPQPSWDDVKEGDWVRIEGQLGNPVTTSGTVTGFWHGIQSKNHRFELNETSQHESDNWILLEHRPC